MVTTSGRETDAIVLVLCQEQARRLLTDEQFAALLGVTRSMWQAVRVGRARPGHRTLRGAAAAFPQFTRLIEDYLVSRNVRRVTSPATVVTSNGAGEERREPVGQR